MQAVLEVVASDQPEHLWQSVVKSFSSDKQKDDDVDQVQLMNALTECYNNANSWETRRQILSIMIPDLTRYRFSVARKHACFDSWQRCPPSQDKADQKVCFSSSARSFSGFITSPYVIQDMSFGQKSIELSTKEIVRVPNVIRMLIPESIVRQYLAYAVESDFKPVGRSTLLRILSVCSASVRKYTQGLDYLSSADLSVVVDQLGDEFMGMVWAKVQKDRLKSAKRYLISDFKVYLKNI